MLKHIGIALSISIGIVSGLIAALLGFASKDASIQSSNRPSPVTKFVTPAPNIRSQVNRPPVAGGANANFGVAVQTVAESRPLAKPADAELRARATAAYAKLPLRFEPNMGQTDQRVNFLARGDGYSIFLTSAEAVIVFGDRKSRKRFDIPNSAAESKKSVVQMKLLGVNSAAHATASDELPGKSNYFIGSDPNSWHTDIPTFGKVKYEGIYDGIDLVYYSNEGQLEFDFVVAPGADPSLIKLAFSGANAIQKNSNGDILLDTSTGRINLHKPYIYQVIDGEKRSVDGDFELTSLDDDPGSGSQQLTFQLAAYDKSEPLIVDPVLSFSTLTVDASGGARGIAVDQSGSVYLVGTTHSPTLPTTPGAFQATCEEDSPGYCIEVAFVAKLSSDGSTLIYSTYIGSITRGNGIAVDDQGSAYVTGTKILGDFPVVNALEPCTIFNLAFVAKLNPTGSELVYSTCLGSSNYGSGFAIAVDATHNAYVLGSTVATDFPTTPGAFQSSCSAQFACGFLAKFNAAGTALIYSTYISGALPRAIAIDSSGRAYIVGLGYRNDFLTTPNAFQSTCTEYYYCSFVMKVNAPGTGLEYSTFLGRTAQIASIAVDTNGSAYVTGTAVTNDIPASPDAFQARCKDGAIGPCGQGDAFVAKLAPDGGSLAYATYLGGSDVDEGIGIAVDSNGHAHVTGFTLSTDFPRVNAFQGPCTLAPETLFSRCFSDAFVTKLNATGSALIYSTNLGGHSSDMGMAITVDSQGNAYVAGTATSGFPTTPGVFRPGCQIGTVGCMFPMFVAKISPSLQFDSATYAIPENGGAQTITVLSDGFTDSVSVNYATSDGSAIAGTDYAPVSGVLTYLPGETVKTFKVPIINDSVFEGKETVLLSLSNPTGHGRLGNFATATLTLTEPGRLQINSSTYTVKENEGNLVVNFTRLEGDSGEVQVTYTVDGETATSNVDFVPSSGVLTFADGETSKTITIPIVNDLIVEPNETATVTLSDPGGGSALGAVPSAILNIQDTDISLEDYFPSSPGDAWTYRRAEDGAETQIAVVAQNVDVNGVMTSVFQNSADGSQEHYSLDANGLRLHRLFTPNVPIEGLGRVDLAFTFNPPITFANLISEVGQTFNSSGTARTNPLRRIGVVEFPYNASFIFAGVETITVPAGSHDVLRLQGSISLAGESPTVFEMSLAKNIGRVRWISDYLGVSETLEMTATTVGVHNFAVTKITPPKTVTLTARAPAQTKQIKVQIQNLGPRTETIRDLTTLGQLVGLEIESLGSCGTPTAVLSARQPSLPITLKPNKSLAVAFDVNFTCANDRTGGRGHEDFRYRVTLHPAALQSGGELPLPPQPSTAGALTDVIVR
jgi:hypothetical protein